MKLTNMLSIYILMAIAAVTAMDLDPECKYLSGFLKRSLSPRRRSFFASPPETKSALLIDALAASLAFKHMNITLAPDAIDILQHHGLWTPSAAALNGLEPMFDDNYNATLENEKFEASGININDLVHLGVIDESSKAVASLDTAGDETGLVDIDVCHP